MDDLKTPGERLHSLIRKAGYSGVAEFARTMGKAVSTVSGHVNGNRGITYKAAKAYAKRLRDAPEYIMDGKRLNQDAGIASIKVETSIASRRVPLLSFKDIDQFRAISQGAIPMSDESVPAPNNLKIHERVFACLMIDESMECHGKQSINKGDEVYIDPKAEYGTGDVVVALAPGFDEAIVRKYRVTSKSPLKYDLIPLNEDFPPVRDAQDVDTRIVGRVVGAFRVF